MNYIACNYPIKAHVKGATLEFLSYFPFPNFNNSMKFPSSFNKSRNLTIDSLQNLEFFLEIFLGIENASNRV